MKTARYSKSEKTAPARKPLSKAAKKRAWIAKQKAAGKWMEPAEYHRLAQYEAEQQAMFREALGS